MHGLAQDTRLDLHGGAGDHELYGHPRRGRAVRTTGEPIASAPLPMAHVGASAAMFRPGPDESTGCRAGRCAQTVNAPRPLMDYVSVPPCPPSTSTRGSQSPRTRRSTCFRASSAGALRLAGSSTRPRTTRSAEGIDAEVARSLQSLRLTVGGLSDENKAAPPLRAKGEDGLEYDVGTEGTVLPVQTAPKFEKRADGLHVEASFHGAPSKALKALKAAVRARAKREGYSDPEKLATNAAALATHRTTSPPRLPMVVIVLAVIASRHQRGEGRRAHRHPRHECREGDEHDGPPGTSAARLAPSDELHRAR